MVSSMNTNWLRELIGWHSRHLQVAALVEEGSEGDHAIMSGDDRIIRLATEPEACCGGFRPVSSCRWDRAPASFRGC